MKEFHSPFLYNLEINTLDYSQYLIISMARTHFAFCHNQKYCNESNK